MFGAAPITLQASSAVAFLCLHALLSRREVRVRDVVGGCSLLASLVIGALGVAARAAPRPSASRLASRACGAVCSSVPIFGGVLFAAAPVLQTLTQSYCNDTIATVGGLLTLLHLASHDYGRGGGGGVSLCAGMSLAGVLASRLPSTRAVLLLLCVALLLFALLPPAVSYITPRSPWALAALTLCAAATAVAGCAAVGGVGGGVGGAGAVAVVGLGGPLLYAGLAGWYQRGGGGGKLWDVAVVSAAST